MLKSGLCGLQHPSRCSGHWEPTIPKHAIVALLHVSPCIRHRKSCQLQRLAPLCFTADVLWSASTADGFRSVSWAHLSVKGAPVPTTHRLLGFRPSSAPSVASRLSDAPGVKPSKISISRASLFHVASKRKWLMEQPHLFQAVTHLQPRHQGRRLIVLLSTHSGLLPASCQPSSFMTPIRHFMIFR